MTQETSCVRLKRWCFTFSRGTLISHEAQIPDQHRPDKKNPPRSWPSFALTFRFLGFLSVCVCVCVPGGERGVWLRLHHTWIYSLLRLSSPGDLWNKPGSSSFGRDIKFQFRANVSDGGRQSKCTSDEWVCHLQITAGDVCKVTFPVLDSKPLLSWINVMGLLFYCFFLNN